MRHIYSLIIVALVMIIFGAAPPAPARAGDLSPAQIAAVPVPRCSVANCSGWFLGANLMGVGSNTAQTQPQPGSVFAAGGLVGVSGGYQYWNGTYFAAAEVLADYDASSGATTLGGKPRYLFAALGKIGTNLAGFFPGQAAPSQGPISIPASLASSLIAPYVQAGAVQRPWGTGWGTGAGATFVIGSGINLDVSYLYVGYGNTQTSPTTSTKTENFVKISVNKMF